jgi:hypothetical protein
MNARAGITLAAPVVLAAGLLYHPYIAVLTDADAVAAAAAADTTRWAVAHLLVALASGLVILAFLAVRSYLREAGEERWSRRGLPLVIAGSTLFTILPAMELTLVAAVQAGADVAAFQTAIDPWFFPILVGGALLFALGAFSFATAIGRSDVLGDPLRTVVAVALVVLALARFVPLGVVQFHVASAAGLVALWPLAYQMARQRRPAPVGTGQPAAAA